MLCELLSPEGNGGRFMLLCGGGEMMEEDQVLGGLGALEAQGNLVGTAEKGLERGLWQRETSACLRFLLKGIFQRSA